MTTSLDLVSTVLILPQRQAALVAKQAAEVAILSDNRLRLGVGTGWNTVEYEALGVPFERRGARQAEQIELMRRLWTEDVVDFDGEFHTVTAASISPRPTRPVPVWFGGSAPAVLKRCARLGDGWMPLGGANDKSRESLDADPHRAGRGRACRWTASASRPRRSTPAARRSGGSRTPSKWAEIGATHMAIATHNAGPTDVDGHLARAKEYLAGRHRLSHFGRPVAS